MGSERTVFYAGYVFGNDFKIRQVEAALDGSELPGTFGDLAGKRLHFETDADGHCIVRGFVEGSTGREDLQCSGVIPAVQVAILPPKVRVKAALEFVLKTAKRLKRDYRKLACDPVPASHHTAEYRLHPNDIWGNVTVWIGLDVPEETARVLLLKIADRMVERHGCYALRPLPKAEWFFLSHQQSKGYTGQCHMCTTAIQRNRS